VEVSTFHNVWAPDGTAVFFAFRAWDQFGNGVGSQGLAVADASGAHVRVLTYNTTGPSAGLNVFDTCPAPSLDGRRVFFMRSLDQGATAFPAVVDATGSAPVEATMLSSLPAFAPSSGCPNWLPTPGGVSVLYMGCAVASDCAFGAHELAGGPPSRAHAAHRWGLPALPAARGRRGAGAGAAAAAPAPAPPAGAAAPSSPFAYFSLAMPTGSAPASWTATRMFTVPLVDTPDTIDSYGITQCDGIHALPAAPGAPITCQGADPTHSFFQRVFVDAATGNTSVVSYDTFKTCMTPRCSLLQATYASGGA
jgi:hypothetical protein